MSASIVADRPGVNADGPIPGPEQIPGSGQISQQVAREIKSLLLSGAGYRVRSESEGPSLVSGARWVRRLRGLGRWSFPNRKARACELVRLRATNGCSRYSNEMSGRRNNAGSRRLRVEDRNLDGAWLTIGGRRLVNFGSCAYMGLNTDPRLKAAAKDAIDRFGPGVLLVHGVYLGRPVHRTRRAPQAHLPRPCRRAADDHTRASGCPPGLDRRGRRSPRRLAGSLDRAPGDSDPHGRGHTR